MRRTVWSVVLQCLYTMCLCEETSGQFKWEEVDEVQYVAGYLGRWHLAWLGDYTPTAQRAAVSQVLKHYTTMGTVRMSRK